MWEKFSRISAKTRFYLETVGQTGGENLRDKKNIFFFGKVELSQKKHLSECHWAQKKGLF